MLNVQAYLRGGNSLSDLSAELGIRVTAHDELPLVVLNYHQIDSPKSHPIVRECRGLVLHAGSFDIVARAFDRFFNWGEMADEMPAFDFSDFTTTSKEDGSLILLYHFAGDWHCNTRGSFGHGTINRSDTTWRQLVCETLGLAVIADLAQHLDPRFTYVGELVGPKTKVVRLYGQSQFFLLTVYDRETQRELPDEAVDDLAASVALPWKRPERYRFSGIDAITAFLRQNSEVDPTFEGVVIRDRENRRWKIKSPTYLSLHKMIGNGDNVFLPQNQLPFILAGEADEFLAYFPEAAETFAEHRARVDAAFSELRELWERTWQIADQKEFALAIKHNPFGPVLFMLRKTAAGAPQTFEDLRAQWQRSEGIIMKRLFER